MPYRSKYKKYHCEHKIYKYHCRDCGGSQVCQHNSLKFYCKECKKIKFCKEHGNDELMCDYCNAAILLSLKNSTW